MAEVPRTKRSEYTGAYKDLQEQIDELRRKIEEIQKKDYRYADIWRLQGDELMKRPPPGGPIGYPDADLDD